MTEPKTDIVEWLRTYARCCKPGAPGAVSGCTAAADEIERLRAIVDRQNHDLECWRTGVFKANRSSYDTEPYPFEA